MGVRGPFVIIPFFFVIFPESLSSSEEVEFFCERFFMPSRIIVDPNILLGKPVIHGSRISVEFVIGLLAQGWKYEDITKNYPRITQDDIIACLKYASEVLESEKVFPIPSSKVA